VAARSTARDREGARERRPVENQPRSLTVGLSWEPPGYARAPRGDVRAVPEEVLGC